MAGRDSVAVAVAHRSIHFVAAGRDNPAPAAAAAAASMRIP